MNAIHIFRNFPRKSNKKQRERAEKHEKGNRKRMKRKGRGGEEREKKRQGKGNRKRMKGKRRGGAIYESYIEDFTNLDGTVNWLPICATGDGIVANQELFEEYNIPLPTDYASFVSACNAFDEDKKEAYRCGMNGFISKPIVIDEVIQELGKIF